MMTEITNSNEWRFDPYDMDIMSIIISKAWDKRYLENTKYSIKIVFSKFPNLKEWISSLYRQKVADFLLLSCQVTVLLALLFGNVFERLFTMGRLTGP